MSDDELSSPETADRVHAYLEQQPVASARQIARDLGIGRSTAIRAVKRLLADGRLTRERLGTGAGYPSRYGEVAPAPSREFGTPPEDPAPRRRTRRGRRARKSRSGGTR